jgi:hypothetical protein
VYNTLRRALVVCAAAVLVSCTPSGTKAIGSFSFQSPAAAGVIDEAAKTISVWVPPDTDRRALVPSFRSSGKKVEVSGTLQVSGSTANDFSQPLTYAVTAADGSTASYVVTLYRSDAKSISSFSIATPPVAGFWDPYSDTMRVIVPAGTDLRSLVATFVITGKEVTVKGSKQESGRTANDFSAPLTYSVAAMDGSTRDYTVIVADKGWQLLSPTFPESEEILALAFDGQGTPHVVVSTYKDSGMVRQAEVRRLSSGVWEKVGKQSLRGSALSWTSLNLDASGVPTVACVTWTGGNEQHNERVTVYRLSEGDWVQLGTAGLMANRYHLAVSAAGAAYLAYYWVASSTSDRLALQVRSWSEDSWKPYGAQGFGRTVSSEALAVDRAGTLWLAYDDGKELVVARHEEGSWRATGEKMNAPREYLALDIDPSGAPHVAYADRTQEGDVVVRVRKLVDSTWQDIGPETASEHDALWICLRVDPLGTPYLAYTNQIVTVVTEGEYKGRSESSYEPVVLKLAEGSWQPVGDAEFVRNLITLTLTMDTSGVPYIFRGDGIYAYR